MDADLAPYRAEGTVVTLRANLRGAKYTLAANAPAAALGIADFADIAPQAPPSAAGSTRSSRRATATA